MFLQSIELQGFRSFLDKTVFELHSKFTLIIGPNSVGKTNLLEGLYCLSYGHGFREKKTEELINQNQQEAIILATVQKKAEPPTQLLLRLRALPEGVSKICSLNQLRKSLREFLSRSQPAVLFQPDDLLLISHTADLRRSYFDRLLKRVDAGYLQARRNYSQGLYKRNKLLENPHNLSVIKLLELIGFWDDYLQKQGSLLQEKRTELLEDFNRNPSLNGLKFKIDYQPNQFVPAKTQEQLYPELKIKRTLTGPQLDEFVFLKLNGGKAKVLAHFGSRSEQRLAVLWLKINELRYLAKTTNQQPLLLMDDIFSELDLENSRRILQVAKDYQTVVTTAHQDILPILKQQTKDLKIITLNP